MSTTPARDRVDLLQGTLGLLILRTLLQGPRHGHAIAKANGRDESTVEEANSENNRRAMPYRLTAVDRKRLAVETSKRDWFAGATVRISRRAEQE
jgi:hypothetical protein